MGGKLLLSRFPVGTVILIDEVGIDINAHNGEYLSSCFAASNPEVLNSLVNAGITGNFANFSSLAIK